jgi:iron(III) transport system ATP-binding protein
VEAIRLNSVAKSYGGDTILDGASLVAAEGSRTAVYGPTGIGKTTLLALIAGLVRVDSGEVFIRERSADGNGFFLPPEARGVGMVFQRALLWPHMNARKNVEFPLYALGLSRKERAERAMWALELFGVGELAGKKPSTLSGGQTQRVALARSVAARPGILLWDEPFTGLDDETHRALAQRSLEYVKKSGGTLVMVSHRREDAALMEARVLVLRKGRLDEEGR